MLNIQRQEDQSNLFYFETFEHKSEALKREYQIKTIKKIRKRKAHIKQKEDLN